jgi:hypothetical protein
MPTALLDDELWKPASVLAVHPVQAVQPCILAGT